MNKVYYNELYDIYGSLLTKRQQEILQLYFQEDFSYAEISEELLFLVLPYWMRYIKDAMRYRNMKTVSITSNIEIKFLN